MTYLNVLKSKRLLNVVNVLGIILAALYFVCMPIAPWIQSGWDWDNVQDIWDRWQSLNVGMLAFISSILALNISRINA